MIAGCVVLIIGFFNTDRILSSELNIPANIETQISESQIYQNFLKFKKKEASFWKKIKGEPTTSDTPSLPVITESPEAQEEVIPEEPVAVEPIKVTPPVTILAVGDSLILEGFGPQFKKKILTYQDVTLISEGKYSTGLNKVSYFDWYARTNELITLHQPDVLLIMIGANDGQSITDNEGNEYLLYTDGWETTYHERVSSYLNLFANQVDIMYWVGHPVPRDENFRKKFELMNRIYQEECAKFSNVVYIDSWARFAVDGKYSAVVADDTGLKQTVKASDGVHLTIHGGNILSDLVITKMKENIELIQKE